MMYVHYELPLLLRVIIYSCRMTRKWLYRLLNFKGNFQKEPKYQQDYKKFMQKLYQQRICYRLMVMFGTYCTMFCITLRNQLQAEAFQDEIRTLKSAINTEASSHVNRTDGRKRRVKKTSLLYELDPFIDENGIHVLSVVGRIRQVTMQNGTRQPAILPKNSHITDLPLPQQYTTVVGV